MIRLPENYIEEMIAFAREEAPNECGGAIAGLDGKAVRLYRVGSSESSPMIFIAEPKATLRVLREIDDNGWSVLALWHSHTHSQGYPSPTDVDVARAWMGTCHFVIVSLQYPEAPSVRAYLIVDGEITEDEIGVEAG